jgi:DNA-binding response OmpR family regulator
MAWTCEHCHAVHEDVAKALRLGDVTLQQSRLVCAGSVLKLTGREEAVMRDLMSARLCSKEALMMRHFEETAESDKIVEVYVHKLRRKLKAAGSRAELKNVFGVGYQLVASDDAQSTSEVVHFADTALNVRQRALICGAASAPLRPQTTYIMEDLMRNFSAPESRLIARYLGRSGDRIKNLRVQMTYIRRALTEIGSSIEIINTRGEGNLLRKRPQAGQR